MTDTDSAFEAAAEMAAETATERVKRVARERAASGGGNGAKSRTNGRPAASEKPLVDEAPPVSTPKTSSTGGTRYRAGMFVEPVTQLYTLMGLGLSMVDKHDVTHIDDNGQEHVEHGVPLCGQAIVQNAHDIGTAWDNLAQKDERVRKALMTLTRASVWGEIVVAHTPLMMAVVANHAPGLKGSLPGGFGL
jgi:hypothetical protein